MVIKMEIETEVGEVLFISLDTTEVDVVIQQELILSLS